jgi:ATP phosphoribosyltransferase regulatory subunit
MSGLAAQGERLAALEAQSTAIGTAFAARGYMRVAPPILQPTDVFLDLMGETIRAKTYTTSGAGGAELCVRPDLTLAVCRLFLESRPLPQGPARLSYDGLVFRLPSESGAPPHEWRHAGIECLNAGDAEAADAEVLSACLAALEATGMKRQAILVEFNDLALFSALAGVIALPDQWRSRLVTHFLQPEKFKRLLKRLSGGAPRNADHANLLSTLSTLPEPEARAVIADVLALAKIQPIGGRSIEEITERLLEQAADLSALSLKPETVKLIEGFVAVSGSPREALAKIEKLLKTAKLSLDDALARFERRLTLFEQAGIDLSRLRFRSEFGRSIGYYTGLIFALRDEARDLNLGSGGRYDGLMTALGATAPIPAVGGALFCTDILDARRA